VDSLIMGMLDGGLQTMFGAAFGGLLLEGRHYRKAEVRDAKGNVTATVQKTQSIKGYRQSMTTAMREAGYADDSALLLILQTYEGRVIDQPLRGETISLDGRWIAGDIDHDAAHVAWVVAASRE
jgi:hypothetical protein